MEDASSSWVDWPSKHIETDFERIVLIIRFIEYVLNEDEVSCLCKFWCQLILSIQLSFYLEKDVARIPYGYHTPYAATKCPSVFAGNRLALSSLLSHRKYRAQSVKALPR